MTVSIADDAAYIPRVNFTEVSVDPDAPGAGHALLYCKDGVWYALRSSGSPTALGGSVALAADSLAVGDGDGVLSALSPGTEGAVPTRQADGSIQEVVPEATSGGGGGSPVTIWPWLPHSFEGHDLAIVNVAGTYGAFIWQAAAGAQNDSWTYTVQMAAGTWTLGINTFTYTSYGVIHVLIDDVEAGTWDCYGNGVTGNNFLFITNVSVGTSGLKAVKFLVSTKNASSAGYLVGINYCAFVRTA